MKQTIRSMSVLSLAASIAFTSCKKTENTITENTETVAELKTHAEDQNRVSGDIDNLTNEINGALESVPAFSGGRQQNTFQVCGISTAIDTATSTWKITLTYNGNDCSNQYFRTGTIVLSTPAKTRWKNAGAAVTASLQNFKVKRLADNKTITLNGSQTLTNVSGGLVINLASTQSIVHTITSNNMSITFDDNSQRTWQVARKRVFTYNNGAVMAIHGIGTNGSVTNAAEWGLNRFGHSFTTSITQPLVIRQDCNFRLTEGEIKHQGFATSTATFGLNASGAPITCPAANAHYYYKLTWTGAAGNSYSVVLPY
ncbi:MAG: hypothetical protein EOO10_04965 [Chitinophagaceae bacterium]|nr:MAG: hypothetical protein EOO10_04965 [Chitinophagaceae bacterium]